MARRKHHTSYTDVMRLSLWAEARAKPPTWQEIQIYLGCSRAVAVRMRRIYLKALTTARSRPAATGTTQQQETAP